MLLAQIKANYSSGDDISSDEETQEEETVKEGNEDEETDENGKFLFYFFKWHISSFPLLAF